MRNKNIIKLMFIGAGTFILSSCSDFLDKMPDNRTELNTPEKVSELLVSAYPTTSYIQMAELMSDNVTDNGPLYKVMNKTVEESYKWENTTATSQDTRQYLWNGCYKNIASANHALEYINSQGDLPELRAQKGEALLCRAYAHFILVNMFCQSYNEQTSTTDLGIPYADAPEKVVFGHYERGTVADVYQKIAKDLEIGLPLIDDSKYNQNAIKYHFNKKAANAFAANFYLFYHKYDESIKCATEALGVDASKALRDFSEYTNITSSKDVGVAYIKDNLKCNYLLLPMKSSWSHNHRSYSRYGHSRTIAQESTIWANAPWSYKPFAEDAFYLGNKVFGSDQSLFYPKLNVFFEYTDVIAGIGYANIVNAEFTSDKTLLCRAEAYTMKKDYANAAKDLSAWCTSHTIPGSPVLTEDAINTFFDEASVTSTPFRTPLNPKFTIEDGKQLNFIYATLYFRRCETLHEGARWFDIKRFGIEVKHAVSGEQDLVLTKDDLRKALQIPDAVIAAGIPANPR